MKRWGVLSIVGGLMVGILGPGCGTQVEEVEPVVTLTAAEQLIDDGGGSTELTVTVVDEHGQKGKGVVRLTTKAGTFGGDGNNTLVPLIDGAASSLFSCPVVQDPACAEGLARITAEWKGALITAKVYVGEKGRELLSGQNPGDGNPVPVIDPYETGTIGVFSANQVYLYGTVGDGGDYSSGNRALSSLVQPMKVFVGFSFFHSGNANLSNMVIRPDGKLVYHAGADGEVGTVRLATLDELTQDSATGGSHYPDAPIANDEVLPTPLCAAAQWGVGGFKVHPTTGEVYYQCSGGGPYYDPAGNPAVPSQYRLLKVGYGSNKLVSDGTTGLYVMASGSQPKRVDQGANPNTSYMDTVTARARSDGYWMVYTNGTTRQLWRLSYQGAWSRVGAYPSTWPAGHTFPQGNRMVIDAKGDAYIPSVSEANGNSIIRFPLDGQTATLAYSEKNRPADAGLSQWPPRLYNTMLYTSFLVTGP